MYSIIEDEGSFKEVHEADKKCSIRNINYKPIRNKMKERGEHVKSYILSMYIKSFDNRDP